jgi:hypothetical protein
LWPVAIKLTPKVPTLTYFSAVSRESVRIALLLAALNDLAILAADIGNAYINVDTRERVCFTAGDECGNEHKGKVALLLL